MRKGGKRREGKEDKVKRVKKGGKKQTEGRECEGKRGGEEEQIRAEERGRNAYTAYEMKTSARVWNRKRWGRIARERRRKNNDDKWQNTLPC